MTSPGFQIFRTIPIQVYALLSSGLLKTPAMLALSISKGSFLTAWIQAFNFACFGEVGIRSNRLLDVLAHRIHGHAVGVAPDPVARVVLPFA